MIRNLIVIILLISLPACAAKTIKRHQVADVRVLLHTTQGNITLKLFPDKAPKSVANFLRYVREGFYNGTLIHRVIAGYLIQGGEYRPDFHPKRVHAPIPSEAHNGLSNLRFTIAVAHGSDPDYATSQFFINLANNRRLDDDGPQNNQHFGYTVFGKVIHGMSTLHKIASLPTHGIGPFAADVPTPLVIIQSARVLGKKQIHYSNTHATTHAISGKHTNKSLTQQQMAHKPLAKHGSIK